ncbi:MAG TPA: hypothetical protein PKH77_00500 [Anaerolineae bacterium]|nr:hypothetical protein [Anaerolineae bacterium]
MTTIRTSPATRVLRAVRAQLRRQGYRVYRRGDTLYWQEAGGELWLAARDEEYIVGGLQYRPAPTWSRVSTHFTWALAEYQQRRIPATVAHTMIGKLTEIWRHTYAHLYSTDPAQYHRRRPARLRQPVAGLGLAAATPRRPDGARPVGRRRTGVGRRR